MSIDAKETMSTKRIQDELDIKVNGACMFYCIENQSIIITPNQRPTCQSGIDTFGCAQ